MHAQYEVCVKFISDMKEGCPSVTQSIAQYPQLVDVLRAMARVGGISSSLRGEYKIETYAEATLRRTCMQTTFHF